MTMLAWGWLFVAFLFVGMLVLLEVGRSIRLRQRAKHADGASPGLGAVEGAIFGLMGLLVAFTFSGAAARFDARRHLIVEEANDIGTAYLRLDLLPAAAQPPLREKFRQYVDARIETYRAFPDLDAATSQHDQALLLQAEIWRDAVTASQQSPSAQAAMLLLPALNAMIDITTTRAAAVRTHPPILIFGLLGALALASSLLAGYGMAAAASRSWLHIFGFVLILGLTVYVILDLEFPRLGLIRIDPFDRVLEDVRATMR